MARTLSGAILSAINARETSEAIIVLLTIYHEEIDPPIRVAADMQDVISNGNTYLGKVPFDITLPNDSEELARAKIRLPNIDRRIMQGIELISTPPRMKIEVVLASNPDQVEITYDYFLLLNVHGDEAEIQGEIGVDDYTTEPWPRIRATKKRLPGVWRFRT